MDSATKKGAQQCPYGSEDWIAIAAIKWTLSLSSAQSEWLPPVTAIVFLGREKAKGGYHKQEGCQRPGLLHRSGLQI